MITLLLACGPAPEPVAVRQPYVPLDPALLARRVSLDLRGVVPTGAELARASDLDGLVDEWMADPRFEQHMADVFVEDWVLHVDELRIESDEFDVDIDGYEFTRAFGSEPARTMARIAAEDLPWTDIVTADWTMANDTLARMAPLEFTNPADPSDWKEAHYTDGRPPGGVIMSSGLWMRYHTTLFNYNRRRAAFLAKYLLCYDFLSRPVSFSRISGTSGDELQAATRSEPGCVSCHAGLDPLASSLFGFWPYEDRDGGELVTYHPERERYGEDVMGVSPAYFGTPVQAATQLGPLVAADPRFETCLVERTATRMWGRAPTEDERPLLDALRADLDESGVRYKALLRDVLDTDAYRAGGLTDEATDAERTAARTLRPMSPLTLASAIKDLTGFRWTWDGWDQLDSDDSGYRVLLGGADGLNVRDPNLDPTVSRSLAIRRLAEASASFAVAHDLAVPKEERRLLGTTDDLADPAAEIGRLHLRVLGRAPTDEEAAELLAFYQEASATAGAEAAWTGVIVALLRDPGFWSY